jgi:hypothetical protein
VIRQGLPLGAWPEPDRNAWAAATAEGDIFECRGAAAHWAETTRNAVIAAYGRWLGFLAVCEPSALAEEPVQRLTDKRLARYLDHLAQTAGTVGQWAYFAHLRDAVRVMFPGEIPQILSRLVARLERECQPRSKAMRIVATPRLIELGEKLMSNAVIMGGKVADLVAYRDGLMIALLAARPIRRRAFSLVRIGVHLRQVGEEWRLVFDGSETKSGRASETIVPERSVPFLERYLREIRPRFSGVTEHSGLWAGTKGTPLTDKAIYSIIAARTREAFGQPVNPHLFRHCAATTIATLQPGRIGLVVIFVPKVPI